MCIVSSKFSLALFLFYFFLALPLASQNSSTSKEDKLEEELSRNWNVVILPFVSDGTEALRTSPLVQNLPSLIEENLSLLNDRRLTSVESEGYTRFLNEEFPLEEIDSEEIARSRSLSYSVAEIESEASKELYYSSIRRFANEGQAPPHSIVDSLRNDTDADLFLTGIAEIQDQYLFLDFILISPYVEDEQKILAQNLFTRRSIEALSVIEEFILWDLGRSIFNAPAGRLEINEVRNEVTTRVYIDDVYFGTLPLTAAPLSVGTHRVELFTEDSVVYSNDIEIVENDTVTLNIEINREQPSQFALNTVPNGISVYLYSQFLGYTPLLLDRSQDDEYFQLLGDEIRGSYFQVSSSTPDMLSLALNNQNFDVNEQVSKDREEFYESLGLTVFAGILPLAFAGISENRTASQNRLSLSGDALRNFQRDSAIINGLTISSIAVTVLFLVNTVDQLLDYLLGTEYARSLLQ